MQQPPFNPMNTPQFNNPMMQGQFPNPMNQQYHNPMMNQMQMYQQPPSSMMMGQPYFQQIPKPSIAKQLGGQVMWGFVFTLGVIAVFSLFSPRKTVISHEVPPGMTVQQYQDQMQQQMTGQHGRYNHVVSSSHQQPPQQPYYPQNTGNNQQHH